MAFTATDILACAAYRHKGDKRRAFGALASQINPRVKDGVWEWSDPDPAVKYYRSLLLRG